MQRRTTISTSNCIRLYMCSDYRHFRAPRHCIEERRIRGLFRRHSFVLHLPFTLSHALAHPCSRFLLPVFFPLLSLIFFPLILPSHLSFPVISSPSISYPASSPPISSHLLSFLPFSLLMIIWLLRDLTAYGMKLLWIHCRFVEWLRRKKMFIDRNAWKVLLWLCFFRLFLWSFDS